MNDLTILITAAGNQYMPGLVKCFTSVKERRIRLVGADLSEDQTILQMMDEVYQVPAVSDPLYIDSLLSICKKENVNILMPVMSAELPLLANNIDRFGQIGTIVSVSNLKSITISNNKLKLYEFMSSLGLNLPKFDSIHCIDDFEKAIRNVGYPEGPVCIKATELSGSRGIRIIDPRKSKFDIMFHEKPNSMYISYDELKATLSERESIPEMMVMEVLPGEEFSIDLLADHGDILYMGARESNSIVASIPMEATLFHNVEAYEIAKKVIKALEMDGNADLDFKYDKNGKPVLMEINPRIAATMNIFAQGGMNLPYLRVKQLLGEELPFCKLKTGIKMKRRYIEMFC